MMTNSFFARLLLYKKPDYAGPTKDELTQAMKEFEGIKDTPIQLTAQEISDFISLLFYRYLGFIGYVHALNDVVSTDPDYTPAQKFDFDFHTQKIGTVDSFVQNMEQLTLMTFKDTINASQVSDKVKRLYPTIIVRALASLESMHMGFKMAMERIEEDKKNRKKGNN